MDKKLTINKSIIDIIFDIAKHGELENTYRIVDYKTKKCAYEVTPFKNHLKIKIITCE